MIYRLKFSSKDGGEINFAFHAENDNQAATLASLFYSRHYPRKSIQKMASPKKSTAESNGFTVAFNHELESVLKNKITDLWTLMSSDNPPELTLKHLTEVD